jgi:hypothetical protein
MLTLFNTCVKVLSITKTGLHSFIENAVDNI